MRILICGSNYGRFYFDALRSSEHEAVGLLARGSERSKRLAQREGVPLYRSIEELPEDIDLACAAMSSSANELVLELIDRGLHVLAEHPQGADFLSGALDLAAERGVCFHLNGHFADLPAQQTWIDEARSLTGSSHPRFLELTVADRALFAALDTLGRGLGGIDIEDAVLVDRSPSWVWIKARIAGIPASLRVQTTGGDESRVLEDASPDYLVDCRLTLLGEAGTLSLMGLTGPVVWLENPNMISDRHADYWKVDSEQLNGRVFHEQRSAANHQAVESLISQVAGTPSPPCQEPCRLLSLARTWETLGAMIADNGHGE